LCGGGGGGGGGHRFCSIHGGARCVRQDAGGRSTGHHRGGRGGRPPVGRVRGRVVFVTVGRTIIVGGYGVRVGDTVGRRRPTDGWSGRVGKLCHGRVVRVVVARVRVRVDGIRLQLGCQFGGCDRWLSVGRGCGRGHEYTEVTGAV